MTSNPWPSSDWVAFLSERGFLAMLALVVAMVALAVDGFRALRARSTTEERLEGAVFLAILSTIVLVGTFDAVTVLAAPALIGWSLLGALAPPSRQRASIDFGGRRFALALITALVFAVAAV